MRGRCDGRPVGTPYNGPMGLTRPEAAQCGPRFTSTGPRQEPPPSPRWFPVWPTGAANGWVGLSCADNGSAFLRGQQKRPIIFANYKRQFTKPRTPTWLWCKAPAHRDPFRGPSQTATPSGIPAPPDCSARYAVQDSGVCSAGLMTTVHPVASAPLRPLSSPSVPHHLYRGAEIEGPKFERFPRTHRAGSALGPQNGGPKVERRAGWLGT